MSEADVKPKIGDLEDGGDGVKGETITIRVRDQTGEETYFKVKAKTKMSKVRRQPPAKIRASAPISRSTATRQVFDAYAQRKGVEPHALRFLIDGERINPTQSPQEVSGERTRMLPRTSRPSVPPSLRPSLAPFFPPLTPRVPNINVTFSSANPTHMNTTSSSSRTRTKSIACWNSRVAASWIWPAVPCSRKVPYCCQAQSF
jgi:hypothetical protein